MNTLLPQKRPRVPLSLEQAKKRGSSSALEHPIHMDPEEVIEEVKRSSLRGRGGAGFFTGVKWGFLPEPDGGPRYLVCNADESEPGTFKDRAIITTNPHLLLEGIAIAAHATRAETAYIYIRGEFAEEAALLEESIAEARDAGILGPALGGKGGPLEVFVHRGAGAYVCGEETALLESIEGYRGNPRIRPPFPAVKGLFGRPTIINNVETLACLPLIMANGAPWFASIGRPKNTGPKLFSVSGHVNRPGVYELPLGVPISEVIAAAGGVRKGHRLKAFIPGGSSAPVLPASAADTPADFDSLQDAGSMLGSGGLIVMDDTTDMVAALANIVRFYEHESCGQCTPCRQGTRVASSLLRRFQANMAEAKHLALLRQVAENAREGRTLCPMGDAFAGPILGMLHHFEQEFTAHL